MAQHGYENGLQILIHWLFPFWISTMPWNTCTNLPKKPFRVIRSKSNKWCDLQKGLLLDSGVETVLDNISSTKASEKDKIKIINYYQNNKARMKYKQYRHIGCGIIGSGAIESAHRTVIQKRMKLSGQRWSINGAKNMLRLRVISMNRQWAEVIDFLKTPQ